MKLLKVFLLIVPFVLQAQQSYLFVGTYTKNTKSEGIYVYSFNQQTLEIKVVDSIKILNPSFLTITSNGNRLYSVSEDDTAIITAYSFDKQKGKLSFINSEPSNGNGPCHISLDKTEKNIAVAHYGSGSVSLFQLKQDGALKPIVQNIEHVGKSVNEKRQEKPHAHGAFFSPNNQLLLVPDLGIDKIMLYSFDHKNGKLMPNKQEFVHTNPGNGPRHLDFHPNGKYLYLLEELSGSVQVFSSKNNQLKSIQQIDTHPKDFSGIIGSADIHVRPDGKFLYCSNRGDENTITVFKIKNDGTLMLVDYQSTLGIKPRNFTISEDGKLLLVGNQSSNEIIILKIDPETGKLSNTNKSIKVPSPVCLKLIKN